MHNVSSTLMAGRAESREGEREAGSARFADKCVGRRTALSLAGLATMAAAATAVPLAQAVPSQEPTPGDSTAQPSPPGGSEPPAPEATGAEQENYGSPVAAGSTRIHTMAFSASDAIILESNGRFAFVDSGEDKDYPDGSDPRYPLRPGVTVGVNYEDILWSYLDQLGVNSTNVDFYLGTHAHSDHIGLADKIIERFKPKRIYTPEYSDEWITNPARLWDNQYVYDKMIAAAKVAEAEYGAVLIQHLDPDAPVMPTGERPHTASPSFDFGDMRIEIFNYKEDYKKPPYVRDANLMSWGVKVSAFGLSAFLAADIENTIGDEDRIAPQIGRIDFLKLGHHGSSTSNTRSFLETLRPKIAFQTGKYTYMPEEPISVLNQLGARWYPVEEVVAVGLPAFVVMMTRAATSPPLRT